MIPESHKQACVLVYRIRPAKRHLAHRQGLIERMGENAGQAAFRAHLKKHRGFMGRKNFSELVNDMKLILEGKENEIN